MTLEQLRIFTAVAEHQHMTRAAEALRLTQSAVSGAIQALEKRHAISLFHRVGRRIELSDNGRTLLRQARLVLAAAHAAEEALEDLRGLKRGRIHIHASQTTGSYWLPQRLASFLVRYPAVDIDLTIANTAQVAAAVAAGTAEIGFVEGKVDDRELVARQVGLDQLVVVVAPEHPWGRLKRLTATQITAAPWVLRERGSGTREVFERALRRARIRPAGLTVALELPSNEAVRMAVEAGLGATALSRVVAEASLRSGTLRSVAFDAIERPFSCLRHRERTLSTAGRAFLQSIGAAI